MSLSLNRYGWLCLAAALLGSAACQRQAPPPTMRDVRAAALPDQESWHTRYMVSENGRPRVHIDAVYMAQFELEDSSFTLLSGVPDSLGRVTAYLFDEQGDSSAVLDANEIRFYEELDRYEARGDVVVTTPEGKRLESEHLTWAENDRKIQTPGFVRITTPTERIQGYTLTADEDLATYSLSRVTGQVTVED